MVIAIANDHAGVELKNLIVKHLTLKGHKVVNFGTDTQESCDYPDFAKKVTSAVSSKNADFGILICGTGVGMSIVANKQQGIRASLCDNSFVAKLTRAHNDSNVLCLGARVIGVEVALDIVDSYISTPFSNEPKHVRRIGKLED